MQRSPRGSSGGDKQRGHSPSRGRWVPVPARAATAAGRVPSEERAQAPVSAPGCCRRGEREKHHQLLLWQCFRRRFWLPLHLVRNLILSVRAVCSQHAYSAERSRGRSTPAGARAAGWGPEPLGRTGAPAQRNPAGSGSGREGSSPSPRSCTPLDTPSPTPTSHLRRGAALGQTTHLHQRLRGAALPGAPLPRAEPPAQTSLPDLPISLQSPAFLVSQEKEQGPRSAQGWQVQCHAASLTLPHGTATAETTLSPRSCATATT